MNVARVYKRLFPFSAELVDLNGLSNDRGAIGFGAPPRFTCPPGSPPPEPITRATAWRPILTSFGYSTLGNEVPHRVRLEFVEKVIPDARFEGGTVVQGARWRQVVFDEPQINFVYITGLPVPVSEESSNPFELRIITEGRQDPSAAVVDWEWARFNNDVTEDLLCRLAQAPRPAYLVGERMQGVGK